MPIGSNENENVELTKSGQIPNFEFTPKSHYELGEKLGMLDFDLATKTTGSRFVFVKNQLALLERAISNFMIDIHVNQNGSVRAEPESIEDNKNVTFTNANDMYFGGVCVTGINDDVVAYGDKRRGDINWAN